MPKISAVIPVFNSEGFIGEAIQSVLDQTFPPSEIIVVDDGSSDGTERVVRRVTGPVPISYYRQQNQGPSVARNLGVSVAQGDWVAFLDADDVWYPQKLDVHVNYMKQFPHIPFFYSMRDRVDKRGVVSPRTRMNSEFEVLLFKDHPPAYPSTTILKKDVFLMSGGFNPSLRFGEDWEFFARIARSFPILCIPQSLARCRMHSNQTHRNQRIVADHLSRFHECLVTMWLDDSRKLRVLAHWTAEGFTKVGRFYLRSGNYTQARRYFRLAFSYDPDSWGNLRRWGLSYLPGFREFYIYRKKKHTDSQTQK